ncbi:MAG: hypothetical protein H7Y42_12290 [Chitinophagaceae bacterium]|nr:hypothetical protein [Chitinophagaceae bacterium]
MAVIKPNFTKADISKMLADRVKLIESAIILSLQRVGEEFVRDCRERGSYQDRTGNLRSSTGYVILQNGQQIFGSGFDQIKEGKDGATAGKKLIEGLKTQFPTGFVLIGVAGMNYAAFVETKGLDVITGSSITAMESLKKALARLNKKI